jgi:hypothetical protein
MNYNSFSWRKLFSDVEKALSSSTTDADIEMKEENEKVNLITVEHSIDKDPKLAFTINENKYLEIQSTNLNSIQINFYLIDLEVLFSRNPFIQQVKKYFIIN